MLSNTVTWRLLRFVLVLFVSGSCTSIFADDWPQWRGIHRDARSDETGLLQDWPKPGPRLAWRVVGLGRGYSSVSIAGKVFTMGDLGSPVNGEAIIALSASDGKKLWTA